jgi:hypothetical protein
MESAVWGPFWAALSQGRMRELFCQIMQFKLRLSRDCVILEKPSLFGSIPFFMLDWNVHSISFYVRHTRGDRSD